MDFDTLSSFLSVINPTLNSSPLVNMDHTIFDSFRAVAIIVFPVPFILFIDSYPSISRHDGVLRLRLIPMTTCTSAVLNSSDPRFVILP